MSDPRPPTLVWAHRGPDDELWLRIHSGTPGQLRVRPEGGQLRPGQPLPGDAPLPGCAPLAAGETDLTVPLPALVDTLTGDPTEPRTWQLCLDDQPVRAGRDATLSLRPLAVAAAGGRRAATLHLDAAAGDPCQLRLEPRDPWVEVTTVRAVDAILTVTGRLVGTGADGRWEAQLVDRDDDAAVPVRCDVEVSADHAVDAQQTADPATGQQPSPATATAMATAAADPDRPSTVTVRCHLDVLEPAATTRTCNLTLTDGERTLRFAGLLDDLRGKHRAIVIDPVVRQRDGQWSVVRPRFTDRDHLVVTIEASRDDPPVDPLTTWELEQGDLQADEDGSAGLGPHRVTRAVARLLVTVLAGWRRLGRVVHRAVASRRSASASAARPPHGASGSGHGEPDPARQIHLLIANLHAAGGTVRATVNLANALASRPGNQVQLVSVYRLLRRRFFAVAPEVSTRVLVDEPYLDRHPGSGPAARLRAGLRRVPSVLVPADDPRAHRFTLYSDLQLLRWLRGVRAGTIVTTRSGLSVVAARFARPGVRIVAQQHVPFATQPPALQAELLASYRRVDAVCVLTVADQTAIGTQLAGARTRIEVLPNALDAPAPRPAPLTAPRIICGGRISPVKGTDLLLAAFAQLAAVRPDWELRIHGSARADRLAAAQLLVRRAGLHDRVRILPPTERLDLELAKASIVAVPSRHEGFGMVIVEALHAGVPVVAFDCPVGPAEILTDGVDGLLVPAEDVDAFASALLRLVDDEALRHRLASAGHRRASDLAPDVVAARFESLLDTLA